LIDLKKYTSIIWDWNGTIMDDSQLVYGIYNEECEIHGLQKLTESEYKKRFYFPVAKFYEEMGLPLHKYPAVAERFSRIYRPRWNEIKVHKQVYEYLQKFEAAKISQFVLSAYEQNELSEMVNFFNLQNYFTEIAGVSADFVAQSKIQRGLELIKHDKIDTSKTLMIGDTAHDFEVAQALGTDACIVAWGATSYEKLAQVCGEKIVFKSLREAFGE